MKLNFSGRKNGTIVINGTTYSGNNIQISNDKVVIDGQVMSGHSGERTLNIVVEGSVETLSTVSGDIQVNGPVGDSITSVSGDINIAGNVIGDIKSTSGDVTIHGSHEGPIKTVSGDVRGFSNNTRNNSSNDGSIKL